jgi:two-component system, OmpR family, response regulator ChvI
VKKILVVDDDIDITLLIKEGLERKGFHIESYNDPQVALQEFKPDFYDLMVVDIRMPKVNGFEFYQGVRKNDIKVKVCFITAFATSYEEIEDTTSRAGYKTKYYTQTYWYQRTD